MFWHKPGRVVLVVEDEPTLLSVITLTLEDEGIEVVPATDAEEALRIFTGRKDIGLVCTNIALAGAMHGVELARQVAAMRPQTQIIISSGSLPPGASELPMKSFFLQKPYDPDKLANTIRRMPG